MKCFSFPCYVLTALLTGCVWLSSCSTPKNIAYFQDFAQDSLPISLYSPQEITFRPKDKISIIVYSRDNKLADMFNLPVVSSSVGSSFRGNYTNTGVSSYTVDSEGNIDFPVLGYLNVEGLKREELAAMIKNELITRNLVNDPIVTVEYVNLYVSVFGEVKTPGQYSIDKDRVTILDALDQAGDLTIYGKRSNVLVIRQEEDKQVAYNVDLCSAENLFISPAYYLRQNDVIYVEPNKMRARQSVVNGNTFSSTSFWISVASLITSICAVIF